MKLRMTILALAFCFGMGCGAPEGDDVTATEAELVAVDKGAEAPPASVEVAATPKSSNDFGDVQKECIANFNACFKKCDTTYSGNSKTSYRRWVTCANRCDSLFDICMNIIMD